LLFIYPTSALLVTVLLQLDLVYALAKYSIDFLLLMCHY
jgi:hypothetical protein